jgi:hypothetical protein
VVNKAVADDACADDDGARPARSISHALSPRSPPGRF